ncbi:MAG: PAS domain S-box protein, partial [Rhizobacter sp.]|nr:PAS domain S-box protein [Rhizobacter sp.]
MSARDRQPRTLEESRAERLAALNLLEDALAARSDAERANAALRESERRQAFLLKLSDALRTLDDPLEIEHAAAQAIGDYLALDRCGYAERAATGDFFAIGRDWSNGKLESLTAQGPLAAFRPETVRAYEAGQMVRIDDSLAPPDSSAAAAADFQAQGVRAALGIPFVESGRLVGVFHAQQIAPRRWTDQEVTLLAETGDRTRTALERARAEAALRESEEKYRELFESIDQGFCTIELLLDQEDQPVDYRFLSANPAYERLTGLHDVVGRTVSEITPWHADEESRIYADIARSGKARRFEQRVAQLERDHEIYAWPVGPAEQHRVAILVNDVTERSHAADAVRESEERVRTIAENLPGAAVFLVDHELRYLLAGGEAVREAGLDPENFLGRTVREMVGPELAALYEPQYRRALAGESFVHEHHAHGRQYVSRGAPLRDRRGEVSTALVVSYDVTDRKRAEEAVRESEQRLRTLADAVPQIIWANDAAGNANYFNRRWYEYSGLSLQESLGPGWQAIVHPEDAPASVGNWQRVLQASEPFDCEYRLRGADGSYRWFIGRNVPMRNAAGHLTGWFGTATDINDLKNAEAALRESQNRLELIVEN